MLLDVRSVNIITLIAVSADGFDAYIGESDGHTNPLVTWIIGIPGRDVLESRCDRPAR
jgi:hypothetical protein